jgi:hypothetical protein
VQGAAGAVESLGRSIGPVWGNTALQHFGDSAPYLSAAAVLVLTLVLVSGYSVGDQESIGGESVTAANGA